MNTEWNWMGGRQKFVMMWEWMKETHALKAIDCRNKKANLKKSEALIYIEKIKMFKLRVRIPASREVE